MPEAEFQRTTRESYDTVIGDYVDRLNRGASPGPWSMGSDELLGRPPLERALWTVLAESVLALGNTVVADIGSGPGRITKELRELGLDAYGIDLSPEMVALARRRYPGLRFGVGSMLALPIPAESVGGIVAINSIVHIPWPDRPLIFAEFRRILVPGGQLMLSFQIGDERRHFDELNGLPVALDWYRQQPEEVVQLLTEAGFSVRIKAVRSRKGAPPRRRTAT
jgi:SAM-dependent methyltransferase